MSSVTFSLPRSQIFIKKQFISIEEWKTRVYLIWEKEILPEIFVV